MKKYLLIILIMILPFILLGCESGSGTVTPTPTHTIHMDDDGDGICDICGENLIHECTIHMDDDHDGICDLCGKVLIEKETLQGAYVLQQKIVSNYDMTNNYLVNCLIFSSNLEVKEVVVDATGKDEKSGSYELNDDELKIKTGVYEYLYHYDKDAKQITFDGMMFKRKVKLTYVYDADFNANTSSPTNSVNFLDELFGDNIDENFYNYCPTAILEDNNTMHVWYCGNKESGNVTDYIMHREAKLYPDGKWVFSSKDIALEHGPNGTWDSRHACDPSVIKGVFNYQGTEYHYLMAYLGCETSNVTANEVGLAASVTPNGPWVKIGNQAVAFRSYVNSTDYGDDGGDYWGYGQPSLLSVDKAGKVLLFYTKGIKLGTYTVVEEWDLSNLENPQMIRENKLGDGGAIGTFNNADFAYDAVNNYIYCIKEDHDNGWYPSDGGVNWISGSNSIYYISCLTSDNEFCDVLFRNHSWAKVSTIGKAQTGYDRVHNCGFLTDSYGVIPNFERIGVLYTMSRLATDYPNWSARGQWPALHTYRIHGFVVER